jgi:hypothetical protein
MALDRSDRVFIFLLLVALAAACYLSVGRMQIERSNKIVEIIVDADDARRVAAASGLSVLELLAGLREAGATALGVREMDLKEMIAAGHIIISRYQSEPVLISPDGISGAVPMSLIGALRAKFPGSEVSETPYAVPGVRLGRLAPDVLMDVPLLLRPEDLSAAHATGLRVVARLGNFPGATSAAIEAAAAEAERAGAKLVIFRDDQVLGYPTLVSETAAAFARHGLLYGYVEMAAQKGQDALAQRLVSQLIRVHSVTDADLETISVDTAITRYARAVRERNIRACYVRLITRPLAEPKETNLRYVAAVTQALREESFRLGPPAPLSAPADWPSRPAQWLVILGVAAGVALLLRRLGPIGTGWPWAAFGVVALLLLALARLQPARVPALGGLVAAGVFPALGLTLALQHARNSAVRPGAGQVLTRGLVGLGIAVLLSFVGGMLIVGLYADVKYLAGIGLFTGVKASYLLPLAVVLLVAIADLPGKQESRSVWRARLSRGLGGFLRSPVSWGQAVALVIALAGVAVVLMRSGNESTVAPSGLELKMRNLLESILIARPRTKEFLLGHPALMLACALAFRGRRAWLPLVALVAAVGQVSLVNTFCHFHIPLHLSLLRSLHGLWIGALIGLLVVLIWRALCDRAKATGA